MRKFNTDRSGKLFALALASSVLAPPALLPTLLPGMFSVAHAAPKPLSVSDARKALAAGDFMDALGGLSGPAANGNAEAQFLLGQMFADGKGVPKDNVMALFWFRRALSGGYKQASAQVNALEKLLTDEEKDRVEKRLAAAARPRDAAPPKPAVARGSAEKTAPPAAAASAPAKAESTPPAPAKPAVADNTRWYITAWVTKLRDKPTSRSKNLKTLNVGYPLLILGPADGAKGWLRTVTADGEPAFVEEKKIVVLDSEMGRYVMKQMGQNAGQVIARTRGQTESLLEALAESKGQSTPASQPATGRQAAQPATAAASPARTAGKGAVPDGKSREPAFEFALESLAGRWSSNCKAYWSSFEPMGGDRFRVTPKNYPRPHIVQASLQGGMLVISGKINDVSYERHYRPVKEDRLMLTASRYERFGKALSELEHGDRYERCPEPESVEKKEAGN